MLWLVAVEPQMRLPFKGPYTYLDVSWGAVTDIKTQLVDDSDRGCLRASVSVQREVKMQMSVDSRVQLSFGASCALPGVSSRFTVVLHSSLAPAHHHAYQYAG
ncbi:hypothetical protein QQF64_012384 [Cirrhinus molitorella]|uniref:Uncharacterized protein n=1 Tax=Cirrhinus molitorella TaxID=172907 RepID=A0ABR3LYK8_9TELE